MSTQFTFSEVPLGNGHSFWIDGNSKITWDNGTYAEPKPNALSLPHIACCPGSTPRCRESCYVHGLRKAAPEVYRKYELNEMALHSVLASAWRSRAAEKLATWIVENAPGGFRWHVSGDVISYTHARWIADVCHWAAPVNFWIYTRSLFAVDLLVRRASNLAVNVSADRDNYQRAAKVAARHGARLCYLVSAPDEKIPDLPPGSVIFPDYPLRGRSLPIAGEHAWWKALDVETRRMVCPADFFGQSEEHRCGPCRKCLRPAS